MTFAYDNNNRLISGSGLALGYDAEDRITSSNGLKVGRDAEGRISSITYTAGKTVNYTYNSQGLLASVSDWVGGSTTLAYDAALELTTVTRPNRLATHTAYGMDGRIASVTEDAGASITITRDGDGKIVSRNVTLPSGSSTPVVAPGMLAARVRCGEQVSVFQYDGMGRLTQDAVHTYGWDMASRLVSRSGIDGKVTATSGCQGKRISLTSSTGTQNFVWNYATSMPTLATVQNGSADQRYYVYLPNGALLYAIDAVTNARTYFTSMKSGSTTLLTNDAGAVTDTYAVTPYGEYGDADRFDTNPFTWLGEYGVMSEGASGLYYMRARYYDSTTSRFLSPDPVFAPTR